MEKFCYIMRDSVSDKWGCPRIAQQIALAFGVEIDKDVVVRRD